ncbi:predicted protein [Coccidioides posadasii str. Silveira]|uniref:Predicted protein n=1 Tax=Coccidioides posadasii (strain RMSCC 757 / Silveira) TaxID=443226 RepID=E9CTY3_COCPS|nr:predicted protein [Coccidioides posadasii str. Silveira]
MANSGGDHSPRPFQPGCLPPIGSTRGMWGSLASTGRSKPCINHEGSAMWWKRLGHVGFKGPQTHNHAGSGVKGHEKSPDLRNLHQVSGSPVIDGHLSKRANCLGNEFNYPQHPGPQYEKAGTPGEQPWESSRSQSNHPSPFSGDEWLRELEGIHLCSLCHGVNWLFAHHDNLAGLGFQKPGSKPQLNGGEIIETLPVDRLKGPGSNPQKSIKHSLLKRGNTDCNRSLALHRTLRIYRNAIRGVNALTATSLLQPMASSAAM